MAENRELALVLRLVADQFQGELKKSGGMLGEFNKFVSDWKVQLTAVGGALFAIAKSTANYGEELLKTSQKVGINVQALAGLQHAANLSDLSNETLSKGLKTLSINMVEAARQTGDGEALFRRLGVSATDAAGKLRPTEQVLLDLADVFAKSKDGAGKAEAAVKLFGKAGLDLIPFLNQGKVGIKELMVEAERLGLVMSQQDAEAANKFNDELKKLQASLRGVTLAVGKELIPGFTQLLESMKDIVSGPVGSLFKLSIQGWAGIFTLFNHAIRETSAEIDVFNNKMDKADIKKLLKDLDSDTSNKLHKIFEMPGSNTPKTGEMFGPPTPKGEIAVLADQEKLGKAKLEIFLAQIRAEEIRNKLAAEGALVDERAYRHLLDFQIQEEKNEEDRQERLGRNIVEQTGLQVRIRDEALAKERDGLAQNAQAWLDYHAQVGGSTQLRYDNELALLQANLSKQLDLTQSETARLLVAWQEHENEVAEAILAKTTLTATQRETIELQTLAKIAAANERASEDVFAGWSAGLRRYVQDQQSMFGLGADMARRFFQTMEQFSQRFFFDAMEGKINGTKQLFASLLNFAQQITSQIAGQLLTRQIGGAITGSGGGTFLSALFGGSTLEGAAGASNAASRGAANPALFGPGFASGGSFRVPGSGGTDSMPIGFWATPGETVDVRTPGQQGGGVSVVINNYGSAPVESAQSGGRGPDGQQIIYVTIRDAVKRAFGEGAMDKTMATRYRMIPQAGG